MSVQEQVAITFRGYDEVSRTLGSIRTNVLTTMRTIRSNFDYFGKSASRAVDDVAVSSNNLSRGFNSNFKRINDDIKATEKQFTDFGKVVNDTTKSFNKGVSTGLGGVNKGINATSSNVKSMGSSFVSVSKSANSSLQAWSDKLGGISASVTSIFGTMGLSSMASQMWANSTQRQTNEIYLSTQKGMEGAKQLSKEIQNIVMQVPGDDTFMTSLLTMSAGIDSSMTVDSLKNLGDALSDYYMAASAKGQLSYETEREMRNYILSGETRALTNSVLGQEIDLLKNKNNVNERALALQQALENSHFAGLGHFESAKNVFEETKGHFQKSFADVGEMILPVIQRFMTAFNKLDSLFGGALTKSLIVLTTVSLGFITVLGVAGVLIKPLSAGAEIFREFGSKIGLARTEFKSFLALMKSEGLVTALRNSFSGLSSSILSFGTNTSVALANEALAKKQLIIEDMGLVGSKDALTAARLREIMAITGESEQSFILTAIKNNMTIAEYMESIALDTNAQSTLANVMAKTGLTYADIEAEAASAGMTVSVWLETYAERANEMSKYSNILATEGLSASEFLLGSIKKELTFITEVLTIANIKSTLSKVKDTVVNYAHAISEKISHGFSVLRAGILGVLGGIQSYNTLVTLGYTSATIESAIAEEGEALTTAQLSELKGIGIVLRIHETIAKIKDTIETWTNTASKIAEGTTEEANILIKVKKIGLTINSIIITVNDTISTLLKSEANATETATEEISNLSKLKSIGLRIQVILTNINSTITIYAHAAANIVDAFAQGLFNLQVGETISLMSILTAPLTVIILLVGGLAIAIYEVGKAFGWWENIGQVFEAIGAGIGRLWDAFMNSEPVKAIQNFIYTIQSAINGILPVLQFFWSNLFGGDENTDGNGVWDIAGQIIDTLGAIFGFLYQISGLKVIVDVINFIGQGIGSLIDALNLFFNSALSQEMFGALREAFDSLKEPFMEIWDALSEVGSAIGEIFGAFSDGDSEDSKSQMNWWIGIIKSIAQFIINYLVPAIKMIAVAIKVVITPFKLVANWMQIFVGLFKGLISGDWSTFNNGIGGLIDTFRPLYDMVKWIVDNAQGIWDSIFGDSDKKINPETHSTMPNQNIPYQNAGWLTSKSAINTRKNLTNTSINKTTNGNTINNYNIGQGAFPIDARNMTQKDAAKTIQLGFGGYLNRRRVTR